MPLRGIVAALVLWCTHSLLAQEPLATVRIEVRSTAGPVEGARVTMNGLATKTRSDGVAVGSILPGKLEVAVRKEGFLPGKTSLNIDEVRVWNLVLELQPQEKIEQRRDC